MRGSGAAAPEIIGPAAETEAPRGAARLRAVVVADGLIAGPDQLTLTGFLDRVDEIVRSRADGVLRGTGWTTKECPYLRRYLERLRDEPAAMIDSAVRMWARPQRDTADGWLEAVGDRAAEAAVAWRDGRPDPLLRQIVPSAAADLAVSAERAASGERDDPRALRDRLGPGAPLASAVRQRAEEAFGVDFSRVRVHVDDLAHQVAAAAGARAFTVGDHVGFASGQYRPGTVVGDAVLAHELAHTLQQSGSSGIARADAALEHDADRAAVAAATGAPIRVPPGRGLALQRCGDSTSAPGDASVPPAASVGSGEQDASTSTAQGEKPITVGPTASTATTPATAQPTVTTPSVPGNFARDAKAAGTITEPSAAPSMPAPLPVEPLDPAAPASALDEPLPLDAIRDSAPFWGHTDAEQLANQIAAAYVARGAKKPRDLASLQSDFDDVMRASFARSSWGVPWQSLRSTLATRLAAARRAYKQQHPKATDDEIAAFMQKTRIEQREAVRQWEAKAAWGWMVERRDRLDFETLGAAGGREVAKLPAGAKLDEATKSRAVTDALAAVTTYATALTTELEAQRAALPAPDPSKPAPKKPSPLESSIAAVAAVATSRAAIETLIAQREAVQTEIAGIAGADAKDAAARKVLETKAGGLDATIRRDFSKLLNTVDELRTKHKLRAIGQVRVGDLVFFPAGAFTWSGAETPIHYHLAEILDAIGKDYGTFGAGSYGGVGGGHASGDFTSAFRSVDLYPAGVPSAGGYFDKDRALAFALSIDRVAAAQGYTYRILYDDYLVAREFNPQAKAGRMSNQDNVEFATDSKGVKLPDQPKNLNWHGPLVTHFHVDFSY